VVCKRSCVKAAMSGRNAPRRRSSMRFAAAWLCGVTWLAQARADAPVELSLRAPVGAGCVSAAQLAERVHTRVGRAVDAQAAPRVEVVIEAHANGYLARVTSQVADGRARRQRELTTRGACDTLDEMLVLVIASSVGVTPASAATPSPRAPSKPVRLAVDWPSERAAPQLAPAAVGGTASRALPWHFELGALAGVVTGLLPSAAFVTGASLLVMHGALGVRTAGTWLPNQRDHAPSPLQLRTTGGLGELGLCGRAAHTSQLAVLFCASAMGGAMRAEADPLWRRTSRWDGLLLLTPRVMARLQLLPRAGLELGLGSSIPLLFPRYTYANLAGDSVQAHAAELGVFAELAFWVRIHP